MEYRVNDQSGLTDFAQQSGVGEAPIHIGEGLLPLLEFSQSVELAVDLNVLERLALLQVRQSRFTDVLG